MNRRTDPQSGGAEPMTMISRPTWTAALTTPREVGPDKAFRYWVAKNQEKGEPMTKSNQPGRLRRLFSPSALAAAVGTAALLASTVAALAGYSTSVSNGTIDCGTNYWCSAVDRYTQYTYYWCCAIHHYCDYTAGTYHTGLEWTMRSSR